ncbi:hypothetical protein EXU30_11915 [Shewanella maritima]|uniref:MSHA biogenesis protein MshF n=1 Tax=Shewanella maritima TaxID=2520507 RepID=A0A411PIK2_9GAMM|nr:hypothetical protein [Shewanella maritima]QBF83328.1 hypothetical protein EXU30_11915 [Shewanella maritima]
MEKQQFAEHDIIKAYGRIISVTILVIVLGVLGYRHFSSIPSLVGQSLAIEHKRLLNILAMVRSQWLSSGRPSSLLLDWDSLASNMQASNQGVTGQDNGANSSEDETDLSNLGFTDNRISLSANGWPLLETENKAGCYRLWHQLLASSTDELSVTYDAKNKICRYMADNNDSVSYQVSSGRVIYFAGGN